MSGADGVMVGRGCYGRPWFLNQVSHFLKTGEKLAPPSLMDQKDLVLRPFSRYVISLWRVYGAFNGT